jgi:hypothetical protein
MPRRGEARDYGRARHHHGWLGAGSRRGRDLLQRPPNQSDRRLTGQAGATTSRRGCWRATSAPHRRVDLPAPPRLPIGSDEPLLAVLDRALAGRDRPCRPRSHQRPCHVDSSPRGPAAAARAHQASRGGCKTGHVTMAPVLETRALDKRFGGIVAASAISITIEKGARHALRGTRGAPTSGAWRDRSAARPAYSGPDGSPVPRRRGVDFRRGKGVAGGNVSKAHNSVHQGELTWVVELETGNALSRR